MRTTKLGYNAPLLLKKNIIDFVWQFYFTTVWSKLQVFLSKF